MASLSREKLQRLPTIPHPRAKSLHPSEQLTLRDFRLPTEDAAPDSCACAGLRRSGSWIVAALAALVLASWCAGQQNPPSPAAKMPDARAAEQKRRDEEQDATTFRVDVKLVNVFATVVDQGGSPVGGLN